MNHEKNRTSGIPYTFSDGNVIYVTGPVVTFDDNGRWHVSHTEFHAIIDGRPAIINHEFLDDAKLSPDLQQAADENFEKSLPEMNERWRRLLNPKR